jgi:8-oxo-dGTP diphosphatase
MKYTYEHRRPALSVDLVIIKKTGSTLQVLLILRARPPFENQWALPGGFVEMDEDLDSAARRELIEETGLKDMQLKQLQAYGNPDRDPRGRVVTVAFYSLISSGVQTQLKSGSDASQARWFPVDELPRLAFDHQQIITDALAKLDHLSPHTSLSD